MLLRIGAHPHLTVLQRQHRLILHHAQHGNHNHPHEVHGFQRQEVAEIRGVGNTDCAVKGKDRANLQGYIAHAGGHIHQHKVQILRPFHIEVEIQRALGNVLAIAE